MDFYYLIAVLILIFTGFLLYRNKDKLVLWKHKVFQFIRKRDKQYLKSTDFIPTKNYVGAMEDYVFKTDTQGTGYYIDKKKN